MSLQSTLNILIEAKRSISKSKHWTKGNNARNKDGDACHASARQACCWCTVGSIYRAAAKATDGSVFDDVQALRILSDVIAPNGNTGESAVLNTLTAFNDAERTTHADVMDLFDKGIAILRERIQRRLRLNAAIKNVDSLFETQPA